MEQITKSDLLLVNDLSKRQYTDNRLLSNASEDEKRQLNIIKKKLKEIARFFSGKYEDSYGPFETSVVTGNDISIGGTSFKRIWSGIFKGAENKQYAAQVSFVLNPNEACLDVGFYFGRASGHSRNREQRQKLERQLASLGVSLSNTLYNDKNFQQKYISLFDYGFFASSRGRIETSEKWLEIIKTNAKESQIIAKVYPNDFNVIESSTIDFYVSQVIFLMGGISNENTPLVSKIKPLSPEQIAKQAQRLAEIGSKGELYILKGEGNKLKSLGLNCDNYPRHEALISSASGYDIASLNDDNKEIWIEVKTTTRRKDDLYSRQFFISSNEYKVYQNNKQRYMLYRVYDIENNPSYEVLDLEIVNKKADGYICKY